MVVLKVITTTELIPGLIRGDLANIYVVQQAVV